MNKRYNFRQLSAMIGIGIVFSILAFGVRMQASKRVSPILGNGTDQEVYALYPELRPETNTMKLMQIERVHAVRLK
jgi:hypothetical protein